jgi:hypothetical protein
MGTRAGLKIAGEIEQRFFGRLCCYLDTIHNTILSLLARETDPVIGTRLIKDGKNAILKNSLTVLILHRKENNA